MRTSRLSTIVAATVGVTASLFAQDAVSRPKVLGVAHMAVYVKDLAKTRQFYEKFLGFGEPFTLPEKDKARELASSSSRSTTTSISRSSMKPTAAKAS